MISAQTDQVVQEHLIEKYMLLPNQVSAVSPVANNHSLMNMVFKYVLVGPESRTPTRYWKY